MKLFVNGKEHDVAPQISLTSLVRSLELPERGIAIAVNNHMIPRTQWDQSILNVNDKVIIIKAACGG